MTPAAQDALLLLAPAQLVDWAGRVFAAKRRRGEEIPPTLAAWLERVQRLHAGDAGILEVMTEEEWEEVRDIVKGQED